VTVQILVQIAKNPELTKGIEKERQNKESVIG